ncbi:FAD-dependent oxidoreductase [Amycolatopsis taiwanensis]|uniref:FAD-dependent oxidoreductase n=1 Tax=Amycolatopsis taiwanensis TaxID=342230 RepID=UPI00048086B3|nr:FAD-dependent oxidoreductase [Amycolatopsis taiwanensis]
MSPRLPAPLSLWVDTAPAPDRGGRPLPVQAEVVVIGAGIAGLTTAYLLAAAGRSVLVLEAGAVGAGVSGHTTAKVTAQHALAYSTLKSRKDKRGGAIAAATYGQAQSAALDWIARTSAEVEIDCAFTRQDSFVYVTDPARLDRLRAEAEAAEEAGLPASLVGGEEIVPPLGAAGAVRFTGQAQFHPRRWLLGLAERIEQLGGRIVEGIRVTQVEERGIVHTPRGRVRGRDVVVATHYPILDRGLFFARLNPVRDLAVAGPGAAVDGMYLDADTHRSLRGYDGFLVVGGEHYRTGEDIDVEGRYSRLAQAALELGMTRLTHRWSAHDMSTLDSVPYVGRYHPAARHLWVATGFGQWGMTGGTAAGLLLDELIRGGDPPAAALFDPNRFDAPSAVALAKDNVAVARHLVGGYVGAATSTGTPEGLRPGEATVTRRGSRFVAGYRTEDGELRTVSARCTHLGCLVAFNNAEKTWDCPCHGSRFSTDGTVIQGPATAPLSPA